MAFSPDNLKIVTGSSDRRIKIWDIVTGKLLNTAQRYSSCVYTHANTLDGHNGFVKSVAFSSDNLKIVSGGTDRSIKIWDAVTGRLLKTLYGHADSVVSIAISNPIYDETDKKLINYLNECINPQ